MLDIANVWSFLLAATLVIVVPGPATFYVIGKTHQSPWLASQATLGIVAGDVVLISVSGFGFASLVARWPLLLLAVKVIGAIYLLYLGWNLAQSSRQQLHRLSPHKDKPAHFGEDFLKGLLITLTNPKPILFFAAFFPLFIKTGATAVTQKFYALGVIFELLNLCYFSTMILIVTRLRHWRAFDRFLNGGFNTACGIALMGCSLSILAAALLRN